MSCGIELLAFPIILPILLAQLSAATAATAVAGAVAVHGDHKARIKPRPIVTRDRDVLTAQTFMNDRDMLVSVLRDYGCEVETADDRILTSVEGARLSFVPGVEQNYEARFVGDMEHEKAEQILTDIQDMYLREVQNNSYNSCVKQADEKGYVLESEEIQPDNSIVLTYEIPE
jgi:hypothetical protein